MSTAPEGTCTVSQNVPSGLTVSIMTNVIYVLCKWWTVCRNKMVHKGSHECSYLDTCHNHYSDVIMSSIVSQITGVLVVCPTVCSGADKRKYQSSASLALVRGIHW